MSATASSESPAVHPCFLQELAAVSTALARLKAAHVAEVEKLELENVDLRVQLALPSQLDTQVPDIPTEVPSQDKEEVEQADEVSTCDEDRFNPDAKQQSRGPVDQAILSLTQHAAKVKPEPLDMLDSGCAENGEAAPGTFLNVLPSHAGPDESLDEVINSLNKRRASVDSTASKHSRGNLSETPRHGKSNSKTFGTPSENGVPSSPGLFRKNSTVGVIAPKVQVRELWLEAASEMVDTYSQLASFKIIYETGMLGRALSRSDKSKSKFIESIEERPMGAACLDIIRQLCSRATLHPSGPPRLFWNVMCLAFICYDVVVVPLHAFDVEEYKAVQISDWLVSVWWTLDVFMSFRTGYYVGSRLEMRHQHVAMHYAKTWLVCDLVIIITEWVSRLEEFLASVSIMRSSRALRSLRLMRLIRLPKVKYLWDGMLDTLNSNVHILCCTMVVLTLVLILVIHFVACIWYAIGTSMDDGWVTYDAYDETDGIFFWYIASSRWVIAQFNGRTDMFQQRNLRERFFTCIVGVVLAVIAHAVFISYITKSMLDLSELVSEKTRLNRLVNHYLSVHPLPPTLSAQIKRCQKEYYDIKSEAYNEEQVLKILPKHVQVDVLYEIRSPIVTTHNFYRTLHFESPSVMRVICRSVVQTVSARKSEVVFRHGDVCNRMLFTDKLTATYSQFYNDRVVETNQTQNPDVRSYVSEFSHGGISQMGISSQDAKLTQVPRDFWISEPAVWTDWLNQGTLVTNTHGFLYSIHPAELAQALKRYSEIYVMAGIYARHLVEELAASEFYTDLLNFEVQLVPPIQVKVTVVSAKGLPNVDGFLTGKSDPYCICKAVGLLNTCSETRFRTPTVSNNLNPVWNHAAEVGLTCNQSLKFEVWDDDLRPNRNTLLGSAQIESDDFIPDGFAGDLTLNCVTWAEGSLKIKIEVLELPE